MPDERFRFEVHLPACRQASENAGVAEILYCCFYRWNDVRSAVAPPECSGISKWECPTWEELSPDDQAKWETRAKLLLELRELG